MVITRRLPSGDILVVFQGILEKQKWEACLEVLQVFEKRARFCIREYTVLVYKVQVRSVNQANQAKTIEAIYSQNPRLRSSVYIIRIG